MLKNWRTKETEKLQIRLITWIKAPKPGLRRAGSENRVETGLFGTERQLAGRTTVRLAR